MTRLRIPDCEECENTGLVYDEETKKVVPCGCVESTLRRARVEAVGGKGAEVRVVAELQTAFVERSDVLLVSPCRSDYMAAVLGIVASLPPQAEFEVKVVQAYELASIFFDRKSTGVDVVMTPGLLVVALAFTTITNSMLDEILAHVYETRALKKRRTWFVVPSTEAIGKLQNLYGGQTAAIARSMQKMSYRMRRDG